MGRVVIEFDSHGGASSMHSDKFPLSFLGKMEVRRASEIKFNPDTQKWDIWLVDADGTMHPPIPEACGFDTYEDGRKAEVFWLDSAKLAGVPPTDPIGVKALTMRRVFTTRYPNTH